MTEIPKTIDEAWGAFNSRVFNHGKDETAYNSFRAALACLFDEAPSPVDRGTGWQDIGTAPFNETVVVYWPIVELDEDGDVTDKIVGGEVFVSENQGGYWIEPEAMNAIGEHMGDHETYANHPSHWMPKPSAPEGSVDG